jgi:hypothetical protein
MVYDGKKTEEQDDMERRKMFKTSEQHMGEGRLLCKEAKNGEKWGHVKYLLRPVEK